jgi:hypothetical protein
MVESEVGVEGLASQPVIVLGPEQARLTSAAWRRWRAREPPSAQNFRCRLGVNQAAIDGGRAVKSFGVAEWRVEASTNLARGKGKLTARAFSTSGGRGGASMVPSSVEKGEFWVVISGYYRELERDRRLARP